MESPPVCTTWSDSYPSNGNSDILLSNEQSGSISSIASCHLSLELQECDTSEKHEDETTDYLSGICTKDCSLLKQEPVWLGCKTEPIEPPPEFQDSPLSPPIMIGTVEKFACCLVAKVMEEAMLLSCKVAWSIQCSQECHPVVQTHDMVSVNRHNQLRVPWGGPRLCWTPELFPFTRPSSRSSLASSRLSSSHNSLSVPAANRADDSSFITSAVSISDLYNVPFDSDIYAVPIDMVPPPDNRGPSRPKRQPRHHRRRRRHASTSSQAELARPANPRKVVVAASENGSKRHSVPGTSAVRQGHVSATQHLSPREPIHMTLHEVRQYLHNLYSSSSDSSENKSRPCSSPKIGNKLNSSNRCIGDDGTKTMNGHFSNNNNNVRKHKKNTFVINIKNKKTKESCDTTQKDCAKTESIVDKDKAKKSPGKQSFSSNLKQTLCNIFRLRKLPSPVHNQPPKPSEELSNGEVKAPFLRRALPPLPAAASTESAEGNEEPDSTPLPSPDDATFAEEEEGEELSMDFATSIEKVKDYGWYWGPICGEAAEKILSNEPDGSFIVRDSSDDHYIFSLTFKLNGCIRHVRIEHDQGNFSFGSCTKFKSHTIVDFIENAVEHSRSGRYLFFLHRRPVLGPMRVQLLHPVSRFKQIQSLQHMCRFVILKLVRRDLIPTLPLPRRIIDYLNTPHYYSEQLAEAVPVSSTTTDEEAVSPVPQGLS